MLTHGLDVDADFLAIYGLDLRDDIDGPRFFALAHRLPAYQGVMAARVEAERDKDTTASSPQQTAQAPAQQGDVREVSLTALRVQFPGLVSMTTSG